MLYRCGSAGYNEANVLVMAAVCPVDNGILGTSSRVVEKLSFPNHVIDDDVGFYLPLGKRNN
jgi:hypothetical protein